MSETPLNKNSESVFVYGTNAFDFSANVLDKEVGRIAALEDNVNTRYDTFMREKSLTTSNNKRSRAWRWIYIVLIMGAIFTVLTMLLRQQFPNMWILDLVIVMIITFSVLYAFYLYLDIINRSPMNFDKVDPNAFQMKKVKADESETKYTVTESDADLCEGGACCSTGTLWSEKDQKCVKPEGFVGCRLQDGFYSGDAGSLRTESFTTFTK